MAYIMGECCCPTGSDCCVCWRDGGDCQGSIVEISTYVGASQNPGTLAAYPCYPSPTPTGPRADDPQLYSLSLDWSDVAALEAGISNPSVIDVGPGVIDVTLSADSGPITRKENAFPSFVGSFHASTPLAFFETAGDVGQLEFEPPVCGVGFAINPNDAFDRDDYFVHVWTTDGSTTYDEGENVGGTLLTTATAVACEAIHTAVFARTSGRKITKIRFGFTGSGFAGPAVPFAIDNVGICL